VLTGDPWHADRTASRVGRHSVVTPAAPVLRGGRARAAGIDPVGVALVAAARSHRAVLQGELTRIGLHLGQELMVADLAEHPDCTQTELVDRLGVEQPTVAKMIARLERVGILTRMTDTGDRRQIRLRLTRRGAALVPRVLEAWAVADQAASAGLTPSEKQTLIKLLHRIADGSTQKVQDEPRA
jgi:DNA-binding MarR family transcriptional regulator